MKLNEVHDRGRASPSRTLSLIMPKESTEGRKSQGAGAVSWQLSFVPGLDFYLN